MTVDRLLRLISYDPMNRYKSSLKLETVQNCLQASVPGAEGTKGDDTTTKETRDSTMSHEKSREKHMRGQMGTEQTTRGKFNKKACIGTMDTGVSSSQK